MDSPSPTVRPLTHATKSGCPVKILLVNPDIILFGVFLNIGSPEIGTRDRLLVDYFDWKRYGRNNHPLFSHNILW